MKMSVNAVRFSANAFYVGYSSRTGSTNTRSATDSGTADGTTVMISKEGRQALNSEKAAQAEQASVQQATASVDEASAEAQVKKLAIAPWLSSYFPNLTPQVGMKITVVNEAYPEWFAAAPSTRDEYSKLFFEHYHSVLKNNGIDNRETEYSMLVADQKTSEQVHRQLFGELQSDPRMAKLMKELGMPSTAYRSYTDPKDWPTGTDPRDWVQ
jgi:hypothetical protein